MAYEHEKQLLSQGQGGGALIWLVGLLLLGAVAMLNLPVDRTAGQSTETLVRRGVAAGWDCASIGKSKAECLEIFDRAGK